MAWEEDSISSVLSEPSTSSSVIPRNCQLTMPSRLPSGRLQVSWNERYQYPQDKPWPREASPPFPPQGARYGSLRCLHSFGRVAIAWPLSPRFVWHERFLRSPHVACTRSGEWPLHGPFPLASFGMKGSSGHLTLPALARESGHCMAPFPSLRLAISVSYSPR